MEKLKESLSLLKNLTKEADIVKQLQKINQLILCDYMIELPNKLLVYPLEVESYYYNETYFPDESVHKNELQKTEKRFGKFYFHRRGVLEKDNIIRGKRGGVDICLSIDDNYLSLLIRSAIFAKDKIQGPSNLKEQILNTCNNADIENIQVLKRAINDPRADKTIIINSNRININRGNYTSQPLRTIVGKLTLLSYKKKTEAFEAYLKENHLMNSKEAKIKSAEILGYVEGKYKNL